MTTNVHEIKKSGAILRGVRITTLLGVCLSLYACSGQGDETVEDSQLATDVAEEESGVSERTVASVALGYGTVRFHELTRADGSLSVAISEEAPNDAQNTPLEQVMLAGHTVLEVFVGLLPDQTPPESLIASHQLEIAQLGRTSDALLPVSRLEDMPIQKSIASCAAWVWGTPPDDDPCYDFQWGNKRQAHNLVSGGKKALHVGQSFAFATASTVAMGVCNDSGVAIPYRIGIDRGGDDSSTYAFSDWASLRAGRAWRWWGRDVTQVPCPGGPPGSICVPSYFPSRYRVEGDAPAGNPFHLKTAELITSPQVPSCLH